MASTDHPVYTRDYAVFTPAVHTFFEQVKDWIDERITGGYVYGVSRVGKTRAIRYWLANLLDEAYQGGLVTVIWTHRKTSRSSQLALLRILHQSLRLRPPAPRSTTDYEWRIANFLAIRAKKARLQHVVLVVDEAQGLAELEFSTLCNLQNLLDEAGVQMTLISVGTHDLTYKHEVSSMGQGFHYASRFMRASARFKGVASIDELGFILDAYDSHTFWPKGSQTSFTNHFFPASFSKGFRLTQCTEQLWRIYIEDAPKALRGELEVPMENVARAVDFLFRKLSPDFQSSTIGSLQLREAVAATHYAATMQTIARSGLHWRGQS